MRIVLVNPCVDHHLQTHRHGIGHLGLGYVAACLLRSGHEVRVIDAKNEKLSANAVIERIQQYDPAMVGITAMTHEICHAGGLCAAIKDSAPRCVTVVGGPHTSALPERTLREFPAIDAAVYGEGEQAACELADAVAGGAFRRDWASIRGIAFRNGDEIHLTCPRPPLADLDALPFPAWELFPRGVPWPIYAGRGCPFLCSFCQRVLGNRIRLRSVDNVVAEIDALEERTGMRSSWFQDEVFGVRRKWTHELLDRLIERNEQRGRVWHWKANSHVNLDDLDLYRKMRRAGCRVLDFGIESGCPEILKRINKRITLDKALCAIRSARQAGIRTNAFFIIGHPGESRRSALQTVRFARRLGADDIAVGVMVPYPGTEIWELARRGQEGYRLLSEDWRVYDKYFGHALELRNLSHRQLEFLHVLTYVWFYAGTGRVDRLARFVWEFRREAWCMVKRLVRVRMGTPGPRTPADTPIRTALRLPTQIPANAGAPAL